MSTHSSSPARVAANQENASRSTGPVTEAGKAKSSRNATTHALTGRTVLLACEDLALYERHLAAYRSKWQPVTEDELLLVQSIADTDWRLSRIPQLILAIAAKARMEMEEEYRTLDPASRAVQIEVDGFLRYEKQLRNLQLQESRLHRRREKDVAELRTVIHERETRRAADLALAANLYSIAQRENRTFDPTAHGFDFSLGELRQYLEILRTRTDLGATTKPNGGTSTTSFQ